MFLSVLPVFTPPPMCPVEALERSGITPTPASCSEHGRRAAPIKSKFLSVSTTVSLALALLLHHPLSMAGPPDMVGFGSASSLPAAYGPQAQAVGDGGTVASSTGAYTYSYPIVVPPGRLGMQPNLALNYNSQGNIYGGLATHWKMSIPEMRVDYSDGRLGTDEHPWIGGLTGGHRLVPVVEPSTPGSDSYRAEVDSSYVRYEKYPDQGPDEGNGPLWIARTPDGKTRYFGDAENIRDIRGNRAYLGDRAPLTREEDQFGNIVDYYWRTSAQQGDEDYYESPASYQIEKIEYTKNASVASGEPFALVAFEYDAKVNCDSEVAIAVGGISTYRSGILRVEGELPLKNITTLVFDTPEDTTPRQVRRVHLAYNEDQCTPHTSPTRQLLRITEFGTDLSGNEISTNPIEFSYGPTAMAYDQESEFDSSGPGGGTTARPLSLTWGRRDSDNPLENTMESMLIDLDGDGRLDRIFSDYGDTYSGPARNESWDGSSMNGCGMVWLRNERAQFSKDPISPATTSSSVPIKLPRINWRHGAALPGDSEMCSLTGQLTAFRNAQPEHLCGLDNTARLVYRFMDVDSDGLPDLVTALSYDDHLYDPTADVAWPPTQGGQTVDHGNLSDPETPSNANPSVCSGEALEPQEGNNGQSFLTYWYRNMGPEAGFFNLKAPRSMLVPIVLSANVGSSTPIANSGGLHKSFGASSFTDINGDGHIDAIWSDGFNNKRTKSGGQIPGAPSSPETTLWSVHLGDGTGHFHEYSGDSLGLPYPWPVPEGAQVSSEIRGIGADQGLNYSLSELVDVNADGLVDLVYWYNENPLSLNEGSFNSNGSSRIYLNNGRGFKHFDGAWFQPKLTNDLSRPGSTTSMSAFLDTGFGQAGHFKSAVGNSRIRFSDFDSDGRPDLLSLQELSLPWANPFVAPFSVPSVPKIYINPGFGTLLTPQAGVSQGIITAPGFMQHRVELTESDWQVTGDFIDLNGDGEPATVRPMIAGGSGFFLESRNTAGKPLRLLNQIDNGRGGITRITYAAQNDPSVATSDQSDYAVMPNHLWVVKDITRTDSISSTFGVSEVRYGDPVWNQNSRGKWGFRGFTTIETSGLHGVGETTEFPWTKQNYDYSVDWSGRISETVLYADGLAASITRNNWGAYSLFNGDVLSYHVNKSETWNCLGSDGTFPSYSVCVAGAATMTQETKWGRSYSHSAAGTNPALLFNEQSTKNYGPLGALADGSKFEDRVYRVYSDDSRYWKSTYQVDLSVIEGGAFSMVSKITSEVDPATSRYYRLTSPAVGDGTNATEESVREDETGLIVAFANAANKNAGNQAQTLYSDSGFKVFPTAVSNYLGHITSLESDLGTGRLLETRGPNPLPCNQSQNAGSETIYDGLGRPVGIYEFGCLGPGGTFAKVLLSSMQYHEFDLGTGGSPAHVVTTLFFDSTDPNRKITSTKFVDGSGRTIRSELDDGTAEPIQTSSVFNDKGQLVRSLGPNPSTSPGASATVETSYSYDSLGRVVAMRGPDASGSAPSPFDTGAWDSSIGSDIAYAFDGEHSIKTTSEHVLDESIGGPTAETTVYSDIFGRMVRVDELTQSGTVATTTYEFDGNDNAKKIVDADGVETIMEHDWLSRRKKVQRGERVWTFAYDLNGNLIFETAPNPIGETADAPGDYSTSTIYDELDRPDLRLLAKRGLSEDQLDDFDAHKIDFTYDNCTNGIGRLCSETSGNNLAKTYVYDPAGRIVEEAQLVSLPLSVVNLGADFNGFAPLVRTTYAEYNLAGALTDTWLPDGPDKASSTHVSYTYDDATGARDTTTYHDASGNPQGDVTTSFQWSKSQRITQQVTGCLTRSWAYDHKGRVIDTSVTATDCGVQSAPVELLREHMTYFDSSEVETQTVFRAGIPQRTFTYGYDKQHQLVSANDGVGGDYSVGFDYSPAGLLSEVREPPTGALAGRDPFVYTYGDGQIGNGDRHAPVSLSGILRNADYSYDHAGNVTKRTETLDPQGASTATDWDFTYDGSDQQREVLLDNGTGGRELYYYDGAGMRYMAVTFASAQDTVPSRIRVWNGGAEIWYAPNGQIGSTGAMNVQSEYAHVDFGRIKTTDRDDPQGPTRTVEASFHNGLGHLMGAVDLDSGEVNASYIYGPYGEIVDSVGGEQDEHLRRFNGKEADRLSKLSYYGYRYYDELSLSWTQADPLFLRVPDLAGATPRAATLYAFTMNNPVRYMDPNGLQPRPEGPPTCDGDCGPRPDGGPIFGDWWDDWINQDISGDDWKKGRENNRDAYAIMAESRARTNAAWYNLQERTKQCQQGLGGCYARQQAFESWKTAVTTEKRASAAVLHLQDNDPNATDHHYVTNTASAKRRQHEEKLWLRQKMLVQLELRPHTNILDSWGHTGPVPASTKRELWWAGGVIVNGLTIVFPVPKVIQGTIWGVSSILGALDLIDE